MGIDNITWSKGNGISLSNEDLTVDVSSAQYTARANIGRTKGKYFWEITFEEGSSTTAMIGIVNASVPLEGSISHNNQYSRYYWASNGNKFPDKLTYGSPYTFGDTIGVFLDLDGGIIKFYKNGVSQGVAFNNISTLGEVFPSFNSGASNYFVKGTANFGNSNFKFLPNDLPIDTLSYDKSTLVKNNKVLLQSNNKVYSLESIDTWHEIKMTSNTAPAPFVASASSINSGTYDAWKAFNGTNTANTDCWLTSSNTKAGWIQLNFGTQLKINRIKITSRASGSPNTPNASPKNFNILGSNDGVVFTILSEVRNQTGWIANETREFTFTNNTAFSFYRVDVLENDGNLTYTGIAKLEFGAKFNTMYKLPSLSMKNFNKYGVNSPVKTDNVFYTKDYILQDTVSEDENGLWKTQLDRKPLNIRFD